MFASQPQPPASTDCEIAISSPAPQSALRSSGSQRACGTLMYAAQPWWSGSKLIQRSKIWRAPGTLPSISSMCTYLYLHNHRLCSSTVFLTLAGRRQCAPKDAS